VLEHSHILANYCLVSSNKWKVVFQQCVRQFLVARNILSNISKGSSAAIPVGFGWTTHRSTEKTESLLSNHLNKPRLVVTACTLLLKYPLIC